MKERPILFSAPMVRAILAGRKTQTRRTLKDQESYSDWTCATRTLDNEYLRGELPGADENSWVLQRHPGPLIDLDWQPVGCPYGKPGDHLWVRETMQATQDGLKFGIQYLADGAVHWLGREYDEQWLSMYDYRGAAGATIPSIHMRRWASRIQLEIVNVRVERLQEISEADANAEGFDLPAIDGQDWKFKARHNFKFTWDSIYKNWHQNPWVWVIEFKRVQEAK